MKHLIKKWRIASAQCRTHAALSNSPALNEIAKVLLKCAAELEAALKENDGRKK